MHAQTVGSALAGPEKCGHCGCYHDGACPRVKAIEFYGDGAIRRVEYHDPAAPGWWGPLGKTVSPAAEPPCH
jgi:hypothetical protein